MIESIFVRNITAGDFWNMERRTGQGPQGGGGQTFIDIPLGGIGFEGLAQFLSVPTEFIEEHRSIDITVNAIGSGELSILTFASRGERNPDRYRITNQNRHSANSQRHAAWTINNGFPKLPLTITHQANIPANLIQNLKIYIVKMYNGNYYAGYVDQATIPLSWPQTRVLQAIFNVSSTGILNMTDLCDNSLALEIINTWHHKPNVLLYGPPGTGKTHIMNALWKTLSNNENIECISLNPTDLENPFLWKAFLFHLKVQ